ncbi:MAG: hypothetical protein JWP59_2493 [Massilia sp.]|nr:hypothetical protein [Massilia sp.]
MSQRFTGMLVSALNAVKKFVEKWSIVFQGLFGILLVQPVGWVMFQRTIGRTAPIEFVVGFLIFIDVLAFWFFCHCLTPDKKQVKPKWW